MYAGITIIFASIVIYEVVNYAENLIRIIKIKVKK